MVKYEAVCKVLNNNWSTYHEYDIKLPAFIANNKIHHLVAALKLSSFSSPIWLTAWVDP